MASACETSLILDERVLKYLDILSNELKDPFTGLKYTFCWEIINTVYSSIPIYSRKFSVKRFERVIQSTAVVVKSKFKQWYKIDTIDTHYVLDVAESQRSRLASKGEHYFTWVTECLKEIVKRKRLLEDESGGCTEMKYILDMSSEMNTLLNIMLPKGEAQKIHFDQGRIKKVISEFNDVQTSITNHLVRTLSSDSEELR